MLDSAATFAARADEIGVLPDELTKLKTLNLATFGTLAYGCSYVPGQADDQPLIELIERICDLRPAPADRIPVLRRLFFESYTLANADLRSRVDRRDDEQPKKLTQAERAARHKDQQTRLTGLELVGELEPSYHLVDQVFQMVEENQLKYIRWEQCTKRDQELLGIRVDPMWKPDGAGIIREVKVQEQVKADTSTDLRLKYALQRRSLALDQARLIDYDKMERWSRIMLEACSAVPIDGYKRVSLEQLQQADLELFKYLIKNTRDGIRPVSGASPLEPVLDRAITSAEIRLRLSPLPAGPSNSSGSKRKADDQEEARTDPAKKSDADSTAKLKRTIENLTGQIRNLKQQRQAGPKGSGKSGKGKRGQPRSLVKMPSELIGQSAVTADNEPICFSFNLNGCHDARPGERCPKGWHVCTRPGCGAPHSQRSHKSGA